jgi:short-subunit dehydrogenase
MFENKVWWITGASSGIGEALAVALAGAGASLILSGRNEAALKDVAGRVGKRTHILPFEATDFDRLPEIADRAWKWAGENGGGIYGLVNNAGISQRSLAVDTALEVYRKIIDIDLLAPIALTRLVLPRMVAAGGGQIVGISSVAGIVGSPLRSAYSAAKHGLIGYHDSVRAETAHQGVKVLVVAPGSVRTNVSKNALDANAQRRGFSDAAIDNGMPADIAAGRIIDALRNGVRELILAEGAEAMIAQLRRADPNALFDRMAQLVAAGYAKQLGAAKE